jgi:hypothetical protein
VAGVALVGLVASGTTTTTSGSTASSGTASAGATEDAAFRTCVEQNGVTAPAGTGGALGLTHLPALGEQARRPTAEGWIHIPTVQPTELLVH